VVVIYRQVIIFSFIMSGTNYISTRWWQCLFFGPKSKVIFFIVLAHWNNIGRVDISRHTFSKIHL